MIRTIAAAVVLASALGAAGSIDAKESLPLVGLRESPDTNALVRLDPATLAPRGAPLRIGSFGQAWSTSADGRRLAVGSTHSATLARPTALRLVDLQRLHVEGTVPLRGRVGRVAATAWVGGQVIAAIAEGARVAVVSVDPVARRVRAQTLLSGRLLRGARTPGVLALLLAPSDGIGATRLSLVDGLARVRTVTLARIVGGLATNGPGPAVTSRQPALAIVGRRAFVLAAGAPPAAVDLDTLAVRYADDRRVAATSKEVEGSTRFAAALGDLRVAVWGLDYRGSEPPVATGVRVLHTATWASTTLDDGAQLAAVATGRLLVWSWPRGSARWTSQGLLVFGADGRRSLTLFEVRRSVRPPQPLVGGGQQIWG